MKRVAVILAVVLGLGFLVYPSGSRAQTVPSLQVNGVCFAGPYNTVVSCNPTPVSLTTARAPIVAIENLGVTGPVPEAAGLSRYTLTIVSQLACFTPTEPVLVTTFGSPQAAIISDVVPVGTVGPAPSTTGTPVATATPAATAIPGSQIPGSTTLTSPQQAVVTVGTDGTATLSLEVLTAAVGPLGLGVSASWPDEGVTQTQQIIPPAGSASSAQATPQNTAASGTPTPVATPKPGPFRVRACVSPLTGQQGAPATLYVQSVAGAVCSASITYRSGEAESTLQHSPQIAGPDGFTIFPFIESSPSGQGTATATCTFAGISERAQTTFFTQHTISAAPVALPPIGNCTTKGLGGAVGIRLSDENPPQKSILGITTCFTFNAIPAPGAPASITIQYVNGTSQFCSGLTDLSGILGCNFQVTGPVGFKAQVTVSFLYFNPVSLKTFAYQGAASFLVTAPLPGP
jgi:hypothetical protein